MPEARDATSCRITCKYIINQMYNRMRILECKTNCQKYMFDVPAGTRSFFPVHPPAYSILANHQARVNPHPTRGFREICSSFDSVVVPNCQKVELGESGEYRSADYDNISIIQSY